MIGTKQLAIGLTMRKQSTYRPKRVSPPMIINRGLQNDYYETKERMIAEAFSGGWATERHFDELCDMRSVLMLAAAHKDDQGVLSMCHAMSIVMNNIRTRYAETQRMGVSGDEVKLLREFCGIYADFWLRQSVGLYDRCCDELNLLMERAK